MFLNTIATVCNRKLNAEKEHIIRDHGAAIMSLPSFLSIIPLSWRLQLNGRQRLTSELDQPDADGLGQPLDPTDPSAYSHRVTVSCRPCHQLCSTRSEIDAAVTRSNPSNDDIIYAIPWNR